MLIRTNIFDNNNESLTSARSYLLHDAIFDIDLVGCSRVRVHRDRLAIVVKEKKFCFNLSTTTIHTNTYVKHVNNLMESPYQSVLIFKGKKTHKIPHTQTQTKNILANSKSQTQLLCRMHGDCFHQP